MKDSVLEQKQAVISEIREKIENSGSLVLVDYRGLTVEQVTDLRKNIEKPVFNIRFIKILWWN